MFRTVLAVLVVSQHILVIPYVGCFAVHAFFILSGYLMTYVMQRTYGYSLTGVWRFAGARLLRLYPMYWATIVATAVLILIVGEDISSALHHGLALPKTDFQIAQNASMIYASWFPQTVEPRLSPATWALTLEITFYVLIALGISKDRRRTWFWFLASVGLTFVLASLPDSFQWRYSFLLSASLPFSMGALLYHERNRLLAWTKQYATVPVLAIGAFLLLVNSGIAIFMRDFGEHGVAPVPFYLNLVIQFGIVTSLMWMKGTELERRWRGWDDAIGRYSYPVYISQWMCGLVAYRLLGIEPQRNLHGLALFGLSLGLIFGLSFVLLKLIDDPVEAMRRRVKMGKAPKLEPVKQSP